MQKKSIKAEQEKKLAETKKYILDTYVSLVKRLKRNPTHAEMHKAGVSRNAVRWNFGTATNLKEEARQKLPELFKNIIDETMFTPENFKTLEGEVDKYQRFVVTTAVTGARVHKGFLKSIKSYCEKNNALLLVIPVSDPAAQSGKMSSWELDPVLATEQLVFGNLELNSNIHISGIKMSAKQIDPTTGLDRLSHDSSFIYGSPKQRLKVIPNSNKKLPHVAMGTGAITLPDYATDDYMSERTAYLANYDHKLGAIIVELNPDEKYFFRQIQAEPKSGNFVDLGNYYKPSGAISRMQAEGLVLGDWHHGETNQAAANAWKEVAKVVEPKDLVLHDLFNGHSVSHWTAKKIIKKAILARKKMTNLEEELRGTSKDLIELYSWIQPRKGKIRITKSNHDDFLPRYLDDGRFMQDHENFELAINLAKAMVNEADPVQVGVELFLPEQVKSEIHWLKRDEDFRIARIECGVHGDKGPNGARGSLENLARSYRAGVFGHSHTPGILRDAWQVGTTSDLDLDYAEGASSWMHTSCIVYPNGARQLINSIEGQWRLEK